MMHWIRKNWFVSAIIGCVMYTLHLLVEYLVVDSVLKFVGVSISLV